MAIGLHGRVGASALGTSTHGDGTELQADGVGLHADAEGFSTCDASCDVAGDGVDGAELGGNVGCEVGQEIGAQEGEGVQAAIASRGGARRRSWKTEIQGNECVAVVKQPGYTHAELVGRDGVE